MIRGTAEDPESYSLIHLSETREVARRMAEYGPEAFKDVNGRPDPKFESFVNQAGKAFGALDAVQADTIMDHKSDEQFKVNWKAKMDYHYVGTIANMLPGTSRLPVGDIAQRYVDVATSDWANKGNSAIDTKARATSAASTPPGSRRCRSSSRKRPISSVCPTVTACSAN